MASKSCSKCKTQLDNSVLNCPICLGTIFLHNSAEIHGDLSNASEAQLGIPLEKSRIEDSKLRLEKIKGIDESKIIPPSKMLGGKSFRYLAICVMGFFAICLLAIFIDSLNKTDSADVAADLNPITSSSTPPDNIFSRLNTEGEPSWLQDTSRPPLNPKGYEATYFVNQSSDNLICAVYVFESPAYAKTATRTNKLKNLGAIWPTADKVTKKGIVITSESQNSSCAGVANSTFGNVAAVPTPAASPIYSNDQNQSDGSDILQTLIKHCQKLPPGFSKFHATFIKNISSNDGVPGILFNINNLINVQDFPEVPVLGPSMATSDIETWKAWGCGGYIYY